MPCFEYVQNRSLSGLDKGLAEYSASYSTLLSGPALTAP